MKKNYISGLMLFLGALSFNANAQNNYLKQISEEKSRIINLKNKIIENNNIKLYILLFIPFLILIIIYIYKLSSEFGEFGEFSEFGEYYNIYLSKFSGYLNKKKMVILLNDFIIYINSLFN